jgi:AcrR family transcriptional regulator
VPSPKRTVPAAPARRAEAAPVAATAVPRRGGRPSRSESAELRERILDTATQLFLTHGYGATSIEEIARRTRISKRTFYHRFADKPELFGAVVHRIVDRLRPPASVPLLDGPDLAATLQRLASLILHAALSPQALALHRLIVAESARFPKLAAVVARQGAADEAVRLIAGCLEREAHAGKLALDQPTFAAQQFLHMIVGLPQRRALGLGVPLAPGEIEAWTRDVVNLFLHGCRGWQRSAG